MALEALLQLPGATPQQLASPFLQAGILGVIVLVEAAVIAFLFMRSEKRNEQHALKLEELYKLRLEERDKRLDDARANQEVMLELHDDSNQANTKRDEVFERVLERLDRDSPRRR